jgi:hypothetical protein
MLSSGRILPHANKKEVRMYKKGFELFLMRPLELGVHTVRKVGEAALRTVDDTRLVQQHRANYLQDHLDILKKDRRKAQQEPAVAQMNGVRILRLTLQDYRATKAGPEPMSQAYLDQVTKNMEDCGVPPHTISDILGNPVAMETTEREGQLLQTVPSQQERIDIDTS